MKALFGFCLAVSILSSCGRRSETMDNRLPTADGVGAAAMPREIAPINAPFEMPPLERPRFPAKVTNILDHGAVQGGIEVTTGAIQKAIDSISDSGGGTVVIPQGKWLTGRLHLKSNVNLEISGGAELHFSGAMEDYLPAVFCRAEGLEVISLGALIYAHKQQNIAVTGSGTIYGPKDGPVREIVLHTVSDSIVSHTTPVHERIYDGIEHPVYFRPYSISPIECVNVLIEGVRIVNGAFWNVVPVYCENVIVRGVRIESEGVPNGDGVNIESCRNVLVEYCTVRTGDDCYCCKAGRNQDGVRVSRPVEKAVFRYLLAERGHGGITFGSETAGQIRDVYVHDCVFDNNNMGIRFKTRRPRGGGGERLVIENIRIDVSRNAIEWDMLGRPEWVGELAARYPVRPVTPLTPFYRHIRIKNVAGRSGRHVVKMEGLPESTARDVVIENVHLHAKHGISLTDGEGIQLKNISVSIEDEPLFEIRDCRDLQVENMNIDTPLDAVFTLYGERCGGIDLSEVQINGGRDIEIVVREGADRGAVKLRGKR